MRNYENVKHAHHGLLLVVIALLATSCAPSPEAAVSGDLMVWHRVTLTFDGPDTAEDADPNPFRDYRLDVTLQHQTTGKSVTVPGFFAADGNAAESSAKAGNKWRAHFMPDEEGEWTYTASFRSGSDVALRSEPAAGEAAAFDGATGTFTVGASDKSGADFRAKGLLRYIGGHHLQFTGNGEYFLKGGADSPENFLAYYEFDDTFDTDSHGGIATDQQGFIHRYEPHAGDWGPGDPVWQGEKGKNIIGALNYLASKGMNSVYFLTYNLDGGDGKDTWMWTAPDVRDRYDVSKLDQWEVVFSHMDRLGLMLHVITQETENDSALGGGPGLNPERSLYYRELVARFSHHPALVWNQGEENNTPTEDRKAIAACIRGLDPYDHPVTVHTHNNRARSDYEGILGDPNFEATSIQSGMDSYNNDAVELRRLSREAGRAWAIFGDEQANANTGVMPDADDPGHDIPRKQALWGNLMGGGSGVEWYFGYRYAHMDLNCEDWRSRDIMWDQTRHALEFFQEHVPFWEAEPNNKLASTEGTFVLAREPDTYVVYLPQGGSARLTLPEGSYSVNWYDPRHGGELLEGSVDSLEGSGARDLGRPPSDPEQDWVALVRQQ